MNSNTEQMNIIMQTKIEDVRISSVLDKGFFSAFFTSPETHSHAFFELLIAVEGDLRIELSGGNTLLVPEKSFCLIPPMIYHSTHQLESRGKKLALCFQIEKGVSDSDFSFYSLCENGLRSLHNDPLVFECEELYWCLKDLKRECNSSMLAAKDCASALLIRCYVLLFRLLCSRLDQATLPTQNENRDFAVSRKVRIENYLYHHSGENISQEDMAKALSLSSRQLNRILQQLYGTSFRQLLIDVRLHKAAQLLTKTDRPIEDVAMSVGYTSLSGFYSAFLAKFGISAGKYRKQASHHSMDQ